MNDLKRALDSRQVDDGQFSVNPIVDWLIDGHAETKLGGYSPRRCCLQFRGAAQGIRAFGKAGQFCLAAHLSDIEDGFCCESSYGV